MHHQSGSLSESLSCRLLTAAFAIAGFSFVALGSSSGPQSCSGLAKLGSDALAQSFEGAFESF